MRPFAKEVGAYGKTQLSEIPQFMAGMANMDLTVVGFLQYHHLES